MRTEDYKLQRYFGSPVMLENDEGDWVKWEDVLLLIKSLLKSEEYYENKIIRDR